jgi:hypothetical protein
MLVHEKCKIGNIEYDYYQIKQVYWDIETLLIGVMVLYYKNNKKTARLVKSYYFNMGDQIEVSDLIDKVKKLHI